MSLRSDTNLDDNSDYTIIVSDSMTDGDHSLHSSPSSRRFTIQSAASSSAAQFNQVISQSLCPGENTSAIIVCAHNKSHNNGEYLNEAFIRKFNEIIGDEQNIEKAKRLIKKMKKLAGLHPDSDPNKIDVPSARMGFALLTGLNHHELKIEALNNLEHLLENDPITEPSSIRLVALAITIMKQLDRDLIQTEILEVQVKVAKIYGLVAELIQRHYGKKHINAITDDLRSQLLKTARALRDLNRLQDTRLDFYVESALEGIKRILDDHKSLYEIFDRVYNLAMLGVSFYFRDLNHAPEYTENAFSNIDIKLKFSWYDAAITILKLGRESLTEPAKLVVFQKFVYDHAPDLNWRFLYQAIEILTCLSINSPDPKIRKEAFIGKRLFEEFPGVLAYKGCSLLGKHLNFKPIVHLEKPQINNHDTLIRLQVAKSLIKISNEAPDLYIRKKARTEFLDRYNTEGSIKIKDWMATEFHKVQGRELAWINEEAPFNIYPLKPPEMDSSALTPRKPLNFISLITHTLASPSALPQEPIKPFAFSSNAVDVSGRSNKIHQQLALCLDRSVDWIRDKFPLKGGIRKVEDGGLAISQKGMQNLIKLLVANDDISTCNMLPFEGNCEGLDLLIKSLHNTGVKQLYLPSGVTEELAYELTRILRQRPGLEIQLSSTEDIEIVSEVFTREGLYNDADEILSSAIEKSRTNKIRAEKLSNLYLKRANLYILQSDPLLAEHDLIKALEFFSGNEKAKSLLAEIRK